MNQVLQGLRVWITRPGPAARRSASRFEDLGAVCTVLPAVHLEALALDAEDRAALREHLDGARLVLTSANAARFFVESLGPDGELLEAVRSLPVSAVGEATARAAAEQGFQVDHLASIALGVELAREIRDEGGVTRVILPGSDLRRPETEGQLREDGVEVLALTVYRTRPIERLDPELATTLRDSGLDAIVLYSPSAAHGVIGAAAKAGIVADRLPELLALGPTTAAACVELGRPAAVSPVEPGEPALLAAIAQWWGERGPAQ